MSQSLVVEIYLITSIKKYSSFLVLASFVTKNISYTVFFEYVPYRIFFCALSYHFCYYYYYVVPVLLSEAFNYVQCETNTTIVPCIPQPTDVYTHAYVHTYIMEPTITIRVAGLGHKVTLKGIPASTTTVDDLRTKVFEATGLPPRFQKLIGPQRLNINHLDEDDDKCDAALGARTLAELGIKDRTKLMLLHSPLYSSEKDAYEKLQRVREEIDELDRSLRNRNGGTNNNETKNPGFVSEIATRICCRLDGIDVAGSEALRAQRKELIQKAEGLEAIAAAQLAKEKESAEC